MSSASTHRDPLVSVLMPTFNGARWIQGSIESFLAQTYAHTELIVIDDASEDTTPSIVEELRLAHPDRIHLVRLPTNRGVPAARNAGLAIARGELIALLDHDDSWAPTKVERQVAVFEARPEVGLVYTAYESFSDATGEVMATHTDHWEGDILGPLLLIGCFVGALTAMFRRDLLDQHHLKFRERAKHTDDYAMWLELAAVTEARCVPEVLARWRRRPGALSQRTAQAENWYEHILVIQDEFFERHPDIADAYEPLRNVRRARWFRSATATEVRRRHPLRALHLGCEALRCRPGVALTGKVKKFL